MKTTETARHFVELYAETYRYLYRRRDPRAKRISGEALAMLQHLRDSGPLTVTEAKRHFNRSQAAISERIERLIKRDLIERIQDERDRRRHFIWLTEKGEELLAVELEVLSGELVRGAIEQMKPAERRELIRGLEALLRASRNQVGNLSKEKR